MFVFYNTASCFF